MPITKLLQKNIQLVWNAMVNCRLKRIVLKCHTCEMITTESNRLDSPTRIILVISAQKLIQKCCEAYLAYILDTQESRLKVNWVPIVYGPANVFPEELSGLPPEREIEFVIDLMPETDSISIASY
ncbi:RVP_2 domain-containing protein [Gossypium australe]|uniref:RVP_2 domain-containing protein n=1 Tax=Gossypium australe TaxID=47621 RepID=A0A5B6WQS7_9ROSI|nr:RVP_2 domain-containing protein [Gossypium australe]